MEVVGERKKFNEQLEVLRAARELISDGSRWCQGTTSKALNGEHVAPISEKAVRWCAIGALYKTVAYPGSSVWLGVVEKLQAKSQELFGERRVSLVNDRLGHEAVLQVFDKVILEIEEQA